MTMKIAVLTLRLHFNYGGILQAWALQTALKRLGHDVVLLNVLPKSRPACLRPLLYVRRIVHNLFSTRKVPILAEQYNKKLNATIRQHTNQFIDQYINVRNVKHLSNIKSHDFGAYVVGSDQVWRRRYILPLVSSNVCDAYLKFANKFEVKRVAYAASFGIDSWDYTESETSQIKQLVQKFDAISVREDSGVDLCQKYLGIHAEHVVDPTMLLDKADYVKLIEAASVPKSKGNLFEYVLDASTEKTEFIKRVASDKGLLPFSVHNPNIENSNMSAEMRVQPPVEEWLRAFHDAEFVVTDSFHACVFSIIFGKPFIVVGNQERGNARFDSLLKMFGLEHHLITSVAEYNSDTDFTLGNDVEHRLSELRSTGYHFLKNAL